MFESFLIDINNITDAAALNRLEFSFHSVLLSLRNYAYKAGIEEKYSKNNQKASLIHSLS